jgi:hypothetical protein
MSFNSITQRARFNGKFSAEKFVYLRWGFRHIFQSDCNMLVGKASLLELCSSYVIQNGSQYSANIFHERREILLKDSHNEIRPVICRLVSE